MVRASGFDDIHFEHAPRKVNMVAHPVARFVSCLSKSEPGSMNHLRFFAFSFKLNVLTVFSDK
jgi:hypothetical protein